MANSDSQAALNCNDLDVEDEGSLWFADALNEVVRFGKEVNSKQGDFGPDTISACKDALARLVDFKTISFLLSDKDGIDFNFTDCSPEHHQCEVQEDVDRLIGDGTFAWALYQNRPVMIPREDSTDTILLHALMTKNRPVGMFVGVITSSFIPDIIQKLVSVLLSNTANYIENSALYQRLNEWNQDLERCVAERTQELQHAMEDIQSKNGLIQRHLQAMKAAIDGIAILDADGNFTFINESFARIHHYASPDALVGASWKTFYKESELERFDKIIMPEIIKEGQWRGESIGKKENGDLFIEDLSITAVSDAGMVWVVRDISNRKKAEKEKTELQQQLFQAQKVESIGHLAGGIAHDFNNLLGGILGYASILKEELSTSQDSIRKVQVILDAAERGAELTQQLLGFARKGQYEKKVYSINSCVEETNRLLARSINKSIQIACYLEPKLWPIEGDSSQLVQVLMNLGINARDAMGDGGEILFETQNINASKEFCAHVPKLEPGHYVCVRVTDTGNGIPAEVINKIFDPFFTTKEVGKGTGLGLSMVYGIIENHGGAINVESRPGHGTTFHLYFPAVLDGKAEEKAPVPEIKPGLTLDKKILVVDDEAPLRQMLNELLVSRGAEVYQAQDGVEALEIFRQHGDLIDLVILDVIMPRMGGAKTFKKIRAMAPRVKILVASGYSDSQEIQQMCQHQGVDFIKKPYWPNCVLQKLTDLVKAV